MKRNQETKLQFCADVVLLDIEGTMTSIEFVKVSDNLWLINN